jgi:hypothetical protein
MKKTFFRLTRRQFLIRNSATALTVTGLGYIPGLLLPQAAQANTEHSDQTLLRMARDIYPHDDLSDDPYLNVLSGLKKDKQDLLDAGVGELDKAAMESSGSDYVSIAAEADRVAVLKQIESTPFFGEMRSALMFGLYNNPELFSHFGYGGSSWEQGGYINRGFDDIDWL